MVNIFFETVLFGNARTSSHMEFPWNSTNYHPRDLASVAPQMAVCSPCCVCSNFQCNHRGVRLCPLTLELLHSLLCRAGLVCDSALSVAFASDHLSRAVAFSSVGVFSRSQPSRVAVQLILDWSMSLRQWPSCECHAQFDSITISVRILCVEL